MRALLDSHVLIWAVDDPPKLGRHAVTVLADRSNELLLSAATIWEISIKVGLKKLTLSTSYRQWMNKAIADLGLTLLPITVEYAGAQAEQPRHHGDPFDRPLAAQAQVEEVPVVSADEVFDEYKINRIWQ